MGEALLGGGEAAGGGVVVDAEVGAAEPAAGRLGDAAEPDLAGRVEDRLGGLDLHLEAEPPVGQAEGGLQPAEQLGEGGDVGGRDHLGEGDHQAVRKPPGPLQQAGQEHVERADASPVAAVGEGLHAQADERRQGARRRALGDLGGGPGRVPVLLAVVAVPVAVLEVDPQVLDRLPGQLGGHPVADGGGQASSVHATRGGLGRAGIQAQGGGQGGPVGGVGVEQAQRLGAVGRGGAGGEPVAADVDGVHRLAAGRVAGVAAGVGGGHLLDGGHQVRQRGLAQRPPRGRRPRISRLAQRPLWRVRHACEPRGAPGA
jgi:hypothetical protein